VAPLAQRRLESLQLGAPALGTLHIGPGDYPVGHDLLGAVHIGQKQVDRLQPLNQAALELLPVARADQPGQGIEGQDALAAIVATAVEPEGGPQTLEQHAGSGMVAVEGFQTQLAQGGEQGTQGAAGLVDGAEVFVVALVGPVVGEHDLACGGEIMQSRAGLPGHHCYGTVAALATVRGPA